MGTALSRRNRYRQLHRLRPLLQGLRPGVLEPRAVNEDGEIVDPDEEESEKTVMYVANAGACIGCKACMRVCTAKGAQVHVPA